MRSCKGTNLRTGSFRTTADPNWEDSLSLRYEHYVVMQTVLGLIEVKVKILIF